MLEGITWILIVVVGLALVFDFVNGFHDSANAIATTVATQALQPGQAVLLAGALNFAGAFLFEGVANTMSRGIATPAGVDRQGVILAALIGATIWNLLTWWWGLPSSSSHALVGSLVGAVLAYRGVDDVLWLNIVHKVIVPGLASPLLGAIVGFGAMVVLSWMCSKSDPFKINKRFRKLQVLSACMMATSHGTNDAQKVMGIITLSLVAAGIQEEAEGEGYAIPTWVKLACASAIALGTSSGGWRIIKTMGNKVAKLQPIHGFAAETSASAILITTAWLGMPVSTTHVISGAIMGVGASKRLSAVRWTVAGSILVAWVLTIPASAVMGALAFAIIRSTGVA